MLRAFREAVDAAAADPGVAAPDRPDAREGAAALLEKRAPGFPRLGSAMNHTDQEEP